MKSTKTENVNRLGAHQKVAYTGTAGNTTAMTSTINRVRVVTTTAAYIKIGVAAVATNNDVYMPANTIQEFLINEGERVSAIQDTAAGNLHVTLLSK